MSIKLHGFGPLFNLLYTDKLEVKRYTVQSNADGTSQLSNAPTSIYSNIPCRASYGGSEDSLVGTLDDKNPIFKPVTVFCPSSYEISKGDLIAVSRTFENGTTMVIHQGYTNKPSKFETHQEFTLVESGVA